MSATSDYESFYSNQTVFLTGGTGGLGTCLLYKLAVELPTRKIYVLVRSKEKAIRGWRASIPNHIDAIINSGKVELVLGDIEKPSLGFELNVISQITSDTTIVINSAADTSFKMTTREAISSNCLSVLNVAALASMCPNLNHFTQVSTSYCNAWLDQDATISEDIHPFYDPEIELNTILTTGTSPNANRFPRPYMHSKHLSEQILKLRFPNLPLAIVRPSCIGSAVRSPFAGYGPVKSLPIEMFFRIQTLNPDGSKFWSAPTNTHGTNILDEIPVDWVSNLILLHAAVDTRGVVHASASACFEPRTFGSLIELYKGDNDPEITWIQDRRQKQSFVVDFYRLTSGDWRFEAGRSAQFAAVKGPLSVSVSKEELRGYDIVRRKKVRRDIDSAVARSRDAAGQRAIKRESRL